MARRPPNGCAACSRPVDVEREALALCEACLAHHHRRCWERAPGCGTCDGTDALVPRSLRALGEPLRDARGAREGGALASSSRSRAS